MESLFKLGILMRLSDMVSGPATRIGSSLADLRTRAEAMEPIFEKFKSVGVPLVAAGALMLGVLTGTVMATAETQKALGELASVGIRDMAALERAGTDFSNRWSGTTKAQFIAAAYDIKSGISSLTDTGVAEFTKLAALTGKATKSTTAEMTSLFATAYGIYKSQYDGLSDIQFGNVFSGGIAASVRAFKTTGGGMAQAISTLGATAATAKVPMQEQLAIVGMLQSTMAGGEAGTKYKAFMQAAAGAGQNLKISLLDTNNQLLSMPEILTKLRGRFGDTLDAVEKMQIQKAFGTQEAVAVIDLLYNKVGDLTGNIKIVSDAMSQGTIYTEQMANAMNQDIGAGIGLLRQRMHNLAETLGNRLIPILAPMFAFVLNIVLALQRFAEKHDTLTRVVMVSLAVIAGLAFALGGVATVIGVIGLGYPAVVTGIGLITGAFNIATAATWRFTAALLTNPVTGIVVAIVAAAMLAGKAFLWMYGNVTWYKAAVDGLLYGLGFGLGRMVKWLGQMAGVVAAPFRAVWSIFSQLIAALPQIEVAVSTAMVGMLSAFPTILKGMWNSGRSIISTLVSGIKSRASGPVDAVKEIFSKVRNLLPFSDAKEGPLSQLTLSGSRIMSTLGEGIAGGAAGLHRTMAAALAGAALTTSIAVAAPSGSAKAALGGAARAEKSATVQGKSFAIHIERLELPGVSNGADFVKQLQAMVEAFDAE